MLFFDDTKNSRSPGWGKDSWLCLYHKKLSHMI